MRSHVVQWIGLSMPLSASFFIKLHLMDCFDYSDPLTVVLNAARTQSQQDKLANHKPTALRWIWKSAHLKIEFPLPNNLSMRMSLYSIILILLKKKKTDFKEIGGGGWNPKDSKLLKVWNAWTHDLLRDYVPNYCLGWEKPGWPQAPEKHRGEFLKRQAHWYARTTRLMHTRQTYFLR